MIRTTHAELTMLRRGAARTLPCPAPNPATGTHRSRPPVTIGRVYVIYAPRTDEKPRESLHALVVALSEDANGVWHVTLRAGHREDRPVFLARDPGGQRSDYAFDPSRAMRDEPEVLGENANDLIARIGRADQEHAVTRTQAIENVRAALAVLDGALSTADRGRLQRLRAQLRRLETT